MPAFLLLLQQNLFFVVVRAGMISARRCRNNLAIGIF